MDWIVDVWDFYLEVSALCPPAVGAVTALLGWLVARYGGPAAVRGLARLLRGSTPNDVEKVVLSRTATNSHWYLEPDTGLLLQTCFNDCTRLAYCDRQRPGGHTNLKPGLYMQSRDSNKEAWHSTDLVALMRPRLLRRVKRQVCRIAQPYYQRRREQLAKHLVQQAYS